MSLITVHSSLTSVFLLLFGSTVFAVTSPANAESQRDKTATSAVVESPAPKRGLNFAVGNRGLESLSFNGQSFLDSPRSGELRLEKSVLSAAIDALLSHASSPIPTPNKQRDAVDLVYPWGRVSCVYGKQGDKMTMRIEISNAGEKEIDELSLRLMDLNFPSVPGGGTLEAGMFGFGFKDTASDLHQYPSVPSAADPQFVVPLVRADYGTGALNFCSDDLECSVGVLHSTNPAARTTYPFVITCHDIKLRA